VATKAVAAGSVGAQGASLARGVREAGADQRAEMEGSGGAAEAADATVLEMAVGARAARIVDGCRCTSPIAHTTTTDRGARCGRG